MADTKMSALPAAGALAGADIFAVSQGGVSKQASATQIATFTNTGLTSPPFVDTTAIVKGSADATKQLRFEVDGFTIGATNVLTPPNQNCTIAGLEVPQTFSQPQTFTPANNIVPVTIAAGTVTNPNTADFLDITGTWNTTAVQTAIKLDVTNTASGAGSFLMDLKTGTTKFNVGVTGAVTVTPTANALGLTVANATHTADSPGLQITQTWNNAGVTFMSIKSIITDTASAAASSFMDMQLPAGTSQWTLSKVGTVTQLGQLRITGAAALTSLIHASTDTTATGLTIFEQASADTDDYDLSFRKARGTVAVPTVITVGDRLGTIIFRGYGGASGYITTSSIRAVSTGTIADTRVASSLIFSTGTDAAPTVLTDRLTISNTGLATFSAGISTGGAISVTSGDITIDTGRAYIWLAQSKIANNANGIIVLSNAAGSSFTRLDIGGTASSAGAIGFDALNGFTIQTAAGAATWNDSSTAGSATVTERYLWGIATPTLTATNTLITYTRASSMFIGGAPVASTNITIGTAYSLYVAGGLSRFDGAVLAQGGTAIPAGGTAGAGYRFSSTANFGIFFGSSTPSLSAAKGSLYLRSDGSGATDRAYINTDGGTTWTALTTVG